MQKRTTAESESPACSLLVVSCDRYRDLWQPFFTLFQQYWPDCDFPVYLCTNHAEAEVDNVRTLKSGDDEIWSKRMRYLLQQVNTDYVLLLLEDFFLDQRVSSTNVKAHLNLLHSLDGVSMRLFPNPPPDYVRNGLGIVHPRAAFRVSLQAGIWNRHRLLEILVDEESVWEFETGGSQRSRAWSSGFYCSPEAVIHYQHVVERGEWFRSAARTYAQLNIGCNFNARPVMGFFTTWKKQPTNRLRRALNKIRSHWLCARYPETLSDAG